MAAVERRRRALRVLLGCVICQMGLGLSYLSPVLLKDIVAEFGWSRMAFSLGASPVLIAIALASPVIGLLTDRFGARVVLTGSTLLLGLSLSLFSAMQSYLQFYAISLLFGLAITGLGDIPVGSVASRWFVRRRGIALAVVYIGSNLGGALSATIGDWIRSVESWQMAFLYMALGSVVVLIPFAGWVVRDPDQLDPLDVGTEAPRAPERGLGLGEAMRTRSFWILAVLLFAFYFYYLGINGHLVAFLTDRGLSDAEAARYFSAAILMGVPGKLLIGLLADRVRPRGALILNFAILTLGSFLILGFGAAPVLPLFIVAHGFTVAAENVLLPLIVSYCFGLRSMARIYGVLMIALLPGGVLGPAFAGYVFDTRGSYELAFAVFALLNLLALASLVFLRREID